MEKNHEVIIFISKDLYRSSEASFSGIVKIVTMFIKEIFKDSIKVERIRIIMYWNATFYLYFLIQKKLLISSEKNADVWRTQVVCHMIYMFFVPSLDYAKLRHIRICVKNSRRGSYGPIHEQQVEDPSWVR